MASLIPGGASWHTWTGQCDTRVNVAAIASVDKATRGRARDASREDRRVRRGIAMRHRQPSRIGLRALSSILLVASSALAAQPNVLSTSPVRHTMAPANTAISITFDQPLLQSSITAASFRVFGRASGSHTAGSPTGTIPFSNGDKTVTFQPAEPFSAGERVRVNLSHDVKAADSTPLRSAGYAFEFLVQTALGTMVFDQIDVMSNRTGGPGGPQTRIYGALGT